MNRTRLQNRRKMTVYTSESVMEFLLTNAERLGCSVNWLTSYAVLRSRACIEDIPSADDLLATLQEWPSAVRADRAPAPGGEHAAV